MALSGDWGRFGAALARLRAIPSSRAVTRTAEQIAGDIAARAKDKLGVYQGTVAEFPAWESLADSTVLERDRLGYPADEPLLRAGDLQQAITTWPGSGPREWMVGIPPGDPNQAAGMAAELGTQHEPQRAFLGPAVIEAGQDITGYARDMVAAVVKGE
jgi:hypothetical protein